MSSNSIFTSSNSEKTWVLGISKNFPQEHVLEIDFDTPFCVFKVPKTLTETKPEAYTPHKIGLGPYHHLRPDLYIMQTQKLAAVRKFIGRDNLNIVHKVFEALIELEPVLRACYDQYLDLDANTLAWIVAIDGLYLIQFLRKYCKENEKTHGDEFSNVEVVVIGSSGKASVKANTSGDSEIERDVIMLENQIPMVLFKKILKVVELDTDLLFCDFDMFCKKHSPLELSENWMIVRDNNQDHLLHRMYYLIVNKRDQEVPFPMEKMSAFLSYPVEQVVVSVSADDVHEGLQFLNQQGLGIAGLADKFMSLGEKIPWNKIWDKIKPLIIKHDPDEQNALVEEIKIPSVTQMFEIAGITFALTPGGIRDIDFKEDEKKFYLPVITVDVHTETVLRNLVAYELSKQGSSREFALYVDLMCGIIDTNRDVEILKDAGIVKGELSDDEIVCIFNGIRRSTKENDEKESNIKGAIDDVNEKYDDVWSVKVKRFVKKYFSVSWKYMRVIVSIVVVVLLTLETFCLAFGCSRWFGGSAAVKSSLFHYAE